MFFMKKKPDVLKILKSALNCELEKIKVWNGQTFTGATLAGQLIKLEEELREMGKAESFEELGNEMADVFIVLGGLRRWDSKVGEFFESTLLEKAKVGSLCDLLYHIQAKMDINRSRNWGEPKDGVYHHKE